MNQKIFVSLLALTGSALGATCGEGQHVVDGACAVCENGLWKPLGDDTGNGDSLCWRVCDSVTFIDDCQAFRGDLVVETDANYGNLLHVSGSIDLVDTNDVSVVSFPELKHAEKIFLSGNANLQAVRFPKLVSTGNLRVAFNPVLDLVDFTKLENVNQNVQMTENPKLASIAFPALQATSTLYFATNPDLDAISLPALESADDISIGVNPNLQQLSMPSLVSVTNTFDLSSQEAGTLDQVSFPALTEVGKANFGESAPENLTPNVKPAAPITEEPTPVAATDEPTPVAATEEPTPVPDEIEEQSSQGKIPSSDIAALQSNQDVLVGLVATLVIVIVALAIALAVFITRMNAKVENVDVRQGLTKPEAAEVSSTSGIEMA